ncbi:hypothetical protein ACFXDJ_08255 [Streptomyces sp. NPDC059443]|uniref:hypothetical protein n=1 Tax=unclassified Streptomyces TaxID=2593676 RepID=UPI0036AADE76
MNEQQAVARADEIMQEAVAGMSPKPALKLSGSRSAGSCLSEFGTTDRWQVTFSYQLMGVPGSAGKQLVRQARDAWVARGYTFESEKTDGDWSKPDTYVSMRTQGDDFRMTAGNGVTDETTGDGIAYLTVDSPCFPKPASGSPSPSAQGLSSQSPISADEASEQRVLAHSSRIYDALRVPHDAAAGAQLRTGETEGVTYVHHAWTSEPLPADRAARAVARAQEYFAGADWRIRAAPGRLVALHPADETVAQLVSAPDGVLRIGVTGPAVPVVRAEGAEGAEA